jgi:Integrase core domain.
MKENAQTHCGTLIGAKLKDPRGKGLWLIVYEDDSSRFIVSYGVYPTPTSKYSVDVLRKAIEKYGKPEEILSDHGTTTFYAVESDERDKGLTDFEKFLIKEKITLIVGKVDHPPTNGKVEKFFDIFEKVKFFDSIDEFMNWCNFIRPHGDFDIERLETPAVIFIKGYLRRKL